MSDKITFERELRGLKSAMAEFEVTSATIVTWDDDIVIEGEINVVPAWKWFLT